MEIFVKEMVTNLALQLLCSYLQEEVVPHQTNLVYTRTTSVAMFLKEVVPHHLAKWWICGTFLQLSLRRGGCKRTPSVAIILEEVVDFCTHQVITSGKLGGSL